jgi:hypothetical protein
LGKFAHCYFVVSIKVSSVSEKIRKTFSNDL